MDFQVLKSASEMLFSSKNCPMGFVAGSKWLSCTVRSMNPSKGPALAWTKLSRAGNSTGWRAKSCPRRVCGAALLALVAPMISSRKVFHERCAGSNSTM